MFLAAMALFKAEPASPDSPVSYTMTPVAGAVETSSCFPEFAKVASASFVVPGLEEGLIPQGLAWLPQNNWFLVSGYHSDGAPSALVAVERESGAVARQTRLRNPDGSSYAGHAGGVAATAGNIVVSGGEMLHVLPLADFLAGRDGESCAFCREIKVPNRASYCFCGDGTFWVGEFRHVGYPTDARHRMKIGKEAFQAWLCGYKLVDGELPLSEKGKLSPPDYILVTPDDVQGASVSDGIVWLSCSFGRGNDSRLLAFEVDFRNAPDGHFNVGGAEVPAWFLGKDRLIAALTAPPMAENLCRVEDDVYIIFESGAKDKRGKNGKTRPVDRCFRFPNRCRLEK